MPPSPIQETVVGNELVIDCTTITPVAVSLSLLDFTWNGPGGNMIVNDSRVTISPTISVGNMYNSTLRFDYLIPTDGGNYTCNVQFFTVNGSSIVTVEDPDCKSLEFYLCIRTYV